MPNRVPPHLRKERTWGARLTDSEWIAFLPFIDTFYAASPSAALRWLLEQEEVRAVIDKRVAEALIDS